MSARAKGRRWVWPLIRRGVVVVLLGMATTIGVAWGVCIFGQPIFMTGSSNAIVQVGERGMVVHTLHLTWSTAAGSSEWVVFTRTVLPSEYPKLFPEPSMSADLRPIVLPWIHASPPDPFPTGGTDESLFVNAFGWPRQGLCWSYRRIELVVGSKQESRGSQDLAILRWLAARGVPVRSWRVPTTPLWRGLAVDSALFALVWFVLLAAASRTRRALRTRRRTRRGLCPMCAYDLKGEMEKGCPECGWNRGRATP